MAFNRTSGAALIMLRWSNTVCDHSRTAREIVHEVIAWGIIGDKSHLHDPLSFSYSNYGERPGQTVMAGLNSSSLQTEKVQLI